VRPNLLRWQWDGYEEFHVRRQNLLLHLFAVPGFCVTLLAGLASLAILRFGVALGCFVATIVCFGLQAFGHKGEANPPIPFDGAMDAVMRIFAEQFVTFPRFVLSGRWRAALKRAS
jgi:hypothetical protein